MSVPTLVDYCVRECLNSEDRIYSAREYREMLRELLRAYEIVMLDNAMLRDRDREQENQG